MGNIHWIMSSLKHTALSAIRGAELALQCDLLASREIAMGSK